MSSAQRTRKAFQAARDAAARAQALILIGMGIGLMLATFAIGILG